MTIDDPDQIPAPLDLEPMHALDVGEGAGVDDLLRRMANTAFTGRSLGEAADVLEAMLRADAWVVMTLTGAMTMAGMNKLIMEMVRRGWINAIVSTGALVGHGMVEDLGLTHFKADPKVSDEEYLARQLNRVYDVIEPEANLDALEQVVRGVFNRLAETRTEPLGTWELLQHLGRELPGAGILQLCAEKDVPVFIPAFTDSELALDFAVHQQLRARDGKPALSYDGFRDLDHFSAQCEEQNRGGKKLGIFTIGGGVPRNWAQQVGPYVDVRNKRLGLEIDPLRYTYGLRIRPDPVHYGHLSGCTYSEGVSWGKFVPESQGGRYAEVLLDATVGWPLLVRAMIERGL